MGPDVIVPVAFFLIVVGGPLAVWTVGRVLAHQERIEMIRHGIVPPPDPHLLRKASRYGWPGGAPPPPYQYAQYENGYYAQRQLRRGIQIAFIGLALLVGLSFIGYRGDGDFEPGAWLLGGLVPLFVGLAQIVTAVLSGARFSAPGFQGPSNAGSPYGQQSPGPSTTGTPPPPPPQPGSYGAWRPGATPEIEKPTPPPDRF